MDYPRLEVKPHDVVAAIVKVWEEEELRVAQIADPDRVYHRLGLISDGFIISWVVASPPCSCFLQLLPPTMVGLVSHPCWCPNCCQGRAGGKS